MAEPYLIGALSALWPTRFTCQVSLTTGHRRAWIIESAASPSGRRTGSDPTDRTKNHPHHGMSVRRLAARDADHSDNRPMTAQLPIWPTTPPAHGSVVLREFTDKDAHLAIELGEDPYIPSSAACPPIPPPGRLWSGSAGSAASSPNDSGTRSPSPMPSPTTPSARSALGFGTCRPAAPRTRFPSASRPRHRDQRVAGADRLRVDHPGPVPGRALHRAVERQLHQVAEAAGYQREGLLRSHQEIGGARRDMLLYATTRPERQSKGQDST